MNTAVNNRGAEEKESSGFLPDIPELRVLHACSLTAHGAFDEAEAVLRKDGAMPSSAVELDLLARIAAYRGQFELAERLWKVVIEKEPNHEPAKMALERLAKPWLVFALAKRISLLAGVAIVVFLSAVGLFVLFSGSQYFSQQEMAQTIILKPASSPVAQITQTGTAPGVMPPQHTQREVAKTEDQTTYSRIPYGHSLKVYTVPGCFVLTNRNETRIVFDDGLFTYLCELKKTADGRLAALARDLKDKASNVWIVIEGHTDSDPMRGKRVYKDNYSLGLSRARAVAEILRSQHQIPGSSLLVASAGEADPPFPGDDRMSKRKNRTVVVRLLPFGTDENRPKGGTESHESLR